MDKYRKSLLEDATQAFDSWISDLTNGELKDMLIGNSRTYTGMPDLSEYSGFAEHEKEMNH